MSSTFVYILKKSAIHPYKIALYTRHKKAPPAISHIYRRIYAPQVSRHAPYLSQFTPPFTPHIRPRPRPRITRKRKHDGEPPTPVNIMKMSEFMSEWEWRYYLSREFLLLSRVFTENFCR